MGRIRTIKPEFPQSETIGHLSRDARLLFIQLWTIVDDDGRARASSRMLASLLYPYDDDAPNLIEAWLTELEKENCVRRYEAEGKLYLDIPKWLEHQKIDHPSKSKIPPFREGLARVRETLAPDLDLGSGPRISTFKKEPALRAAAADEENKKPKRGRKPSSKVPLPNGWEPHGILTTTEGRELEKMRDWARSNAIIKADWDATFRNWLRRAEENRGKPNGTGQVHAFAPRRGSREDTRERLVQALDQLEDYGASGPDTDGSVDGGEAGEAPIGRLSEPKRA